MSVPITFPQFVHHTVCSPSGEGGLRTALLCSKQPAVLWREYWRALIEYKPERAISVVANICNVGTPCRNSGINNLVAACGLPGSL